MRRSAPPPRRLWLSLHLPALALEALCPPGATAVPVAITGGRGTRAVVLAGDTRARRRGVRPGMPVGVALARVPELVTRQRDAAAETAALEALAAWSAQFTSFTSLVPGQGLLLEVGGSLALFGGLGPLLAALRAGVAELGYGARTAVAPTPLGARLLARAGLEQEITALEDLPAQLDAVPLECMELGAETVAALRGMGLGCFGDCRRLPREGLARRLEAELPARLDRALGRLPDACAPWRPPPVFERRLALPAGVGEVTALLFAARRMLLELQGFLTARSGSVRRLRLELRHRGRPASAVRLELVSPTRDARHLLGLLRERLEGAGGLPAAVEELVLRARDAGPLAPRNLELFEEAPQAGEPPLAWLERLRARLGEQGVRGLACVAEHRPERAWRHCAPGERCAAPDSAPRPLWLLPEPRALRTVDGAPWLDGALRLVRGAERIESGWWDGAGVRRDYHLAEGRRGERYWIFRELGGRRRWYLHGIFA